MISLLGRVILDVGPCLSWLWIFLAYHFFPAKFPLRKSYRCSIRDNCFSLAAFKILYLSLTFGILIMLCPGMDLCVHLVWDSALFGLVCLFLHMIGKFSVIIFSHGFLILTLSLLLLTPPCEYQYAWSSPEAPYTILTSLILFSFCCSYWVFSASLSSKFLIWSSLHLLHGWFPIMYPVHLMYSSFLIGSFFMVSLLEVLTYFI